MRPGDVVESDEDQGFTAFPHLCAVCGAMVKKRGPCPGGCGYSY